MRTMMRDAGRWCLAMVTGILIASGPAHAAKPAKLALVIGNSVYGGGHDLPNAANDARLIGETLRKLGFGVTERYNLGRDGFVKEVDGFASALPAGATAFVYYAGHGMQLDDSNYLTPVGMQMRSSDAAKLQSYALTTLLDRLKKSKAAVNIVVLDACRNNPFQPAPPTRFRSFRGMGLSAVSAPRGTLIAFSTSPGQLAPDGKGKNSLYTSELAKTLVKPGTELVDIFRQVGNEVRHQSHDEQIPWLDFALAGDVYFSEQDQARLGASLPKGWPQAAGGRAQPSRSLRTGSDTVQPWFRTMTVAEANQVDWEIQQRVRQLTPDELPALQHQAEGGSVVAQTVLGLAHREGIETVRVQGTGQVARYKANNRVAWKWLKKAAAAGFPMAQAEIGEMYYRGHGTEVDLRESRYWLEQAARTGYPRARLDLLQLQAVDTPGKVDFKDAAQAIMESIRAISPTPAAPAKK
ncbi:MAG: caspase family protein [Janthinobacterium lividum]